MMQPPPRLIKDFTIEWKDWLFFLWNKVEGNALVSETSGDYTIAQDTEIVFADPAASDITITLVTSRDGRRIRIKNTDESGTYSVNINPGTDKIEQLIGVPSTSDIILSELDSITLIFKTDTWWIV
jgi:hypothetical protein